jgi:zinc transporter, ZIP family
MQNPVQVFLFALLTAVATGLGALPFVFVKSLTRRWLGASNAVAAGLMLAASFGLLYEGVDYGLLRTLAGALTGLVFIVVVRKILQRDEHPAVFAQMNDLDARKALLIVGVMTMHYDHALVHRGCGRWCFLRRWVGTGSVHHAGHSRSQHPRKARHQPCARPPGGWMEPGGPLERLLQFAAALMAVPAFIFVETFRTLLPYGLGFAAGAMIWMVFSELVPDALQEASGNLVAIIVTLSVLAMVAFQVLIR